MKTHVVESLLTTVVELERVAPNLLRLKLARPMGFQFVAGQAACISLPHESTAAPGHPFSMVSHPNDLDLEFYIRVYRSDGITERFERLQIDDELRLSPAFGELTYAGPGLMIAGGTGVTPFLAMLRSQKAKRALDGNFLLYSEKQETDFIQKEELDELLGTSVRYFVTGQDAGASVGRIDDEVLSAYITPDTRCYYLCGPPDMVAQLRAGLIEQGVGEQSIVTERAAESADQG